MFDALATRAKYEPWISNAANAEMVTTLPHERLFGHPVGSVDTKLIADRLFVCFGEVLRDRPSSATFIASQQQIDQIYRFLPITHTLNSIIIPSSRNIFC